MHLVPVRHLLAEQRLGLAVEYLATSHSWLAFHLANRLKFSPFGGKRGHHVAHGAAQHEFMEVPKITKGHAASVLWDVAAGF